MIQLLASLTQLSVKQFTVLITSIYVLDSFNLKIQSEKKWNLEEGGMLNEEAIDFQSER